MNCRICLESHNSPDNPIISPCACSGSIKWVHRACLQEYRLKHAKKNVFKCELCQKPYRLRFDYHVETYCTFRHIRERLGTALLIYAFMTLFTNNYDVRTNFLLWCRFFHLVYMSTFVREIPLKLTCLALQGVTAGAGAVVDPETFFLSQVMLVASCESWINATSNLPETVLQKSINNIKRLLVPY